MCGESDDVCGSERARKLTLPVLFAADATAPSRSPRSPTSSRQSSSKAPRRSLHLARPTKADSPRPPKSLPTLRIRSDLHHSARRTVDTPFVLQHHTSYARASHRLSPRPARLATLTLSTSRPSCGGQPQCKRIRSRAEASVVGRTNLSTDVIAGGAAGFCRWQNVFSPTRPVRVPRPTCMIEVRGSVPAPDCGRFADFCLPIQSLVAAIRHPRCAGSQWRPPRQARQVSRRVPYLLQSIRLVLGTKAPSFLDCSAETTCGGFRRKGRCGDGSG